MVPGAAISDSGLIRAQMDPKISLIVWFGLMVADSVSPWL